MNIDLEAIRRRNEDAKRLSGNMAHPGSFQADIDALLAEVERLQEIAHHLDDRVTALQGEVEWVLAHAPELVCPSHGLKVAQPIGVGRWSVFCQKCDAITDDGLRWNGNAVSIPVSFAFERRNLTPTKAMCQCGGELFSVTDENDDMWVCCTKCGDKTKLPRDASNVR